MVKLSKEVEGLKSTKNNIEAEKEKNTPSNERNGEVQTHVYHNSSYNFQSSALSSREQRPKPNATERSQDSNKWIKNN